VERVIGAFTLYIECQGERGAFREPVVRSPAREGKPIFVPRQTKFVILIPNGSPQVRANKSKSMKLLPGAELRKTSEIPKRDLTRLVVEWHHNRRKRTSPRQQKANS
jgi:hypothetical protein